jgi:methionyl-tRNA synthetase
MPHYRETCPCCGYKSITGSFDICALCNWEHDPAQESDPDDTKGANNGVSLRMAQSNFAKFGACARQSLELVRAPTRTDERDPGWKPVA